MSFSELHFEQLYDGTGAHLTGVFPPLCVNNTVTEEYEQEKARRPFASGVGLDEHGHNLGLVWMMPLETPRVWPIRPGVIGALVQAVDAGQGVMIHSDDRDAAGLVTGLVLQFVGGGHV